MSQTNTDPETASQPMTGTWSDLIGHDRIRDWFATAIKQGRFGGSMLFVGPPGSGKKTAAKLLQLEPKKLLNNWPIAVGAAKMLQLVPRKLLQLEPQKLLL